LSARRRSFGYFCVRVGVVGALIFSILQIFPTGDRAAHNVAEMQPAAHLLHPPSPPL
jgi:cytochrome bd-type quinol oxidase subunit 1